MMRIRLAVLLLIAALAAGCTRGPRSSVPGSSIETAVVRKGTFEITIPMMGQLDAAEGTPVISRYGSDKTGWSGNIEWVAEDGKPIEKGELVMELAAPETERYLRQLELDLEMAAEATREAEASSEREVQNARNALDKAKDVSLAEAEAKAGAEKDEAALAFAQEQLATAQAELARRKRLAEAKLIPRSRVEEAADKVAEGRFELDKAKEELEANKAKRALEAESRQLEIEKAGAALEKALLQQRLNLYEARKKERSLRRELEETQAVLEEARIFAPASGILMLGQTWDFGRRPLRAGDTVNHFRCVARIVSFDKMIVRCQFDELDMARVRKDQDARIRVMGVPRSTFSGRLKVVENLATEGDPWEGTPAGKRICRAIVEVLGSDPRLRPGMTAMVQAVVGRAEGLHVPVECLFRRSSETIVYRREGDRFRAVPVKPGQRGDLMVAITGDIKRGDRVARRRPPRTLIAADRSAKG